MAMIPCHECGKEISDKAEACPHCGAKPYQPYRPSGCLIVFVVLLFFGLISMLRPSPSTLTSTNHAQQPDDPASSAAGACMLFIKQVLHDPDSAEFANSSEAYVKEESPNLWVVQRSVRAKNGFNAMRKSTFECKMSYNNEIWNPINVKEIN